MVLSELLETSERFATQVFEIASNVNIESVPERVKAAAGEALLSLEHWRCVGTLLLQGGIPSALVVQLEQVDAVTRSLWVMHVATDAEVREFASYQSLARDQVTSMSLPARNDMMDRIKESPAKSCYHILSSAREARWSYSRQALYYSWRAEQIAGGLGSAMLHNSNAVGGLGALLAVEFGGSQTQRDLLRAVFGRFPMCLARSQQKWLIEA